MNKQKRTNSLALNTDKIISTKTMEQIPKYHRFDRRTLGVLDTTKFVIESLAIGSISGGALTKEYDSFALLTLALLIIRLTVSRVLANSIAINPINIDQAQTVTLPEPTETAQTTTQSSTPDVMPADAENHKYQTP